MTVLEEIKEVATSSAIKAECQDTPRDSYAPDKALREFRDVLLDLRADLAAFYKIAVLDARRSDSSEEIPAIWREVLFRLRLHSRSSDDLREIDSAASKITVLGARYPEKLEQMTGR